MGALRDSFKISHAADTILLLTSEPITIASKKDGQYTKDVLELAREGLNPGSRKYESMMSIEAQYPLSEKTKDTYARLQIVKDRGGRTAEPLFKYEKALHNFVPIDLELDQQEPEQGDGEDAFT